MVCLILGGYPSLFVYRRAVSIRVGYAGDAITIFLLHVFCCSIRRLLVSSIRSVGLSGHCHYIVSSFGNVWSFCVLRIYLVHPLFLGFLYFEVRGRFLGVRRLLQYAVLVGTSGVLSKVVCSSFLPVYPYFFFWRGALLGVVSIVERPYLHVHRDGNQRFHRSLVRQDRGFYTFSLLRLLACLVRYCHVFFRRATSFHALGFFRATARLGLLSGIVTRDASVYSLEAIRLRARVQGVRLRGTSSVSLSFSTLALRNLSFANGLVGLLPVRFRHEMRQQGLVVFSSG